MISTRLFWLRTWVERLLRRRIKVETLALSEGRNVHDVLAAARDAELAGAVKTILKMKFL
jgi:hypothetical protein